MIRHTLTAAIALVACLVPVGALRAQGEVERPNIVFIMADDLGYGHLGCYGQTKIRTPHLDRMAAEGTRFTQVYAGHCVCAPSRSVLMTGYHSGHSSVRINGGGAPLLPEDVTVAEVLKEAGYKLSQEVAKCLYTGLITDTGCFRFSGVNSRTLEIGAEFLATGFDSYELARPLFEENSFGRVQLERLILERMELLLDGRLTVSTLYAGDFGRVGADRSETENLVDRLREIRGVEVGVLITESANGPNRVSFRSKGRIDVSTLAGAMGGGGHRSAAGSRFYPDFE